MCRPTRQFLVLPYPEGDARDGRDGRNGSNVGGWWTIFGVREAKSEILGTIATGEAAIRGIPAQKQGCSQQLTFAGAAMILRNMFLCAFALTSCSRSLRC